MAANQHSAAGQALGYVYQVGWGLLELARPGPDEHWLRLETVDDVSWHDDAGDAISLLQIKHHLGAGSSLADMHVDVWRTVQIWLDDPSLLQAGGPLLCLVTTQSVPADGALARLNHSGRDVGRALQLLNEAAEESTNKQTEATRAAWLATPSGVREAITERVYVIADQAPAQNLRDEVRSLLSNALPVGREDAFIEALTGWWWRVGIDLLRGNRRGIRRIDLRLKIDDLRDQFSSRSLPITVGRDAQERSLDDHRDRVFAHQLDWIGAGEDLLVAAIRDYYRAYAQAQAWVEGAMVELSELSEYEHRVVEEWEMQFGLMKASLGEDASEGDLRQAGMRLFGKAMNQSPALLRPGMTDAFFSRGTHHRLADERRMGWHPEFAQRLEALLQSRAS
ncbi:hypothetical protein SAMN06264364_11831 [Quadrisphaera granulorum]|uniref:ABC-three component systems C-terminal domain-containing protein n=1 Tax=Quadrisphaera granulorum TaxID=317664 RepID=A0A316A6Q4_9ACTN|nr:ABC-three component system protein [Quadrisphaera granulorum]PWJ52660.1 hypothetical protein BXY45_11831 [Quadrisphaera granulorum]SZE97482.1 hypothetical protein SAMN06264364_11831 [Quadrisphaera granulorum]